MGQLANKTGESEMLSFEKFPFTGLSKVSLNGPDHVIVVRLRATKTRTSDALARDRVNNAWRPVFIV